MTELGENVTDESLGDGAGGRGSRCGVLAAIGISVVALAAIGGAAFVTRSSTSAEVAIPDSDVPVAPGISTLLLGTGEINEIAGATDIEPKREYSFPANLPKAVNPPECGSVALPGLALTYADADRVAMTAREFGRPSRDYFETAEAAVAMKSPQEAREFLEAAKRSWQSCHDGLYGFEPSPVRWYMRDFDDRGDMITAFTLAEETGFGCQRALGVAGVYIVDVGVCTAGGSDEAERIATRVMAKVTADE